MINYYFALDIEVSDSIFPAFSTIVKSEVSAHKAKCVIPRSRVFINRSHNGIIAALKERFDIAVEIPEVQPAMTLVQGDALIILRVRGLPILTGDSEALLQADRSPTKEQIESAIFEFSMYEIISDAF